MPLLVGPALAPGSLRKFEQTRLGVDEQLALRPWRADDAAAVRAAFACPDIQRWHVRRIDSDDEARTWIAGWAERWADETDASWAIVDERADQPVGQVGLRTVLLAEASAQLSYWVVPGMRGAGIAARAVRTLTRWAFGPSLGLNRLFLQHSTANPGSCRVAAKAGFDLEGTLRGSMLHADGWHDVHLHARLRTDADPGRTASDHPPESEPAAPCRT
jgi:RimJ/RimL family protein N-acetyltransferase